MDNPGGSPDKSADEQQRRRSRPQNSGSDGEKDEGGSSSVAPGEGNEDIGAAPPPPPPSQPQSTAGGVVVTDPAASSSSGKKKRRTAIFDAPTIPGPCSICGKQYQSWRALFGHMKKHRKDRAWEGVFPPPAFTPPEGRSPERTGGQSSQGAAASVGQDLATTLLHLAEGIMARMTAEGTTDGAAVAGENAGEGTREDAASSSSPARGIGVDLNAAPEGTNIGVDLNAAPEESGSPSSPARRRDVGLDLNMPAPETDEDDDAAA